MVFRRGGKDILDGVFWLMGANHNFITNGPHHIFPSGVAILMLLHDSLRRESNDRTLFIASFLPFVSAFVSIGALPFVLLSLFQTKFRRSFTLQNILIGPLLAAVAGLFLLSNNGQFLKGWIWRFVDMSEAFPYLLIFYLLGFGLYFLVMPKNQRFFNKRELIWLYGAVACILIFPIYRMGTWMDFPIKAFYPSWIIFQVFVAMALSRIFTRSEVSLIDKLRGGMLITLIFIGSVSAINNLNVALTRGLFENRVRYERLKHINSRKSKASLQLFSDGKTFFWKYLAKTVIYEPRNQITDEFGNSFSLTSRRCGKQDFQILVNGRRKGCGENLSKTKDGYVQLFSSFGDIATYREKGWKYDLYMDKFGNTFTVDSKKCNQNQGFYILVNGIEDGCCVELSKTVDGFTEKLTSSGHTWRYTPQGWFRKHSIANINEIDSLDETNNIKSYILLKENQQSFYINNGWAFVEGTSSLHSDTWLVLQSQSERYIFPTDKEKRFEIVNKYGGWGYMYSGIRVQIPKKDIKQGFYRVGILITQGHEILGFNFINKTVVRNYYPYELQDLKLTETNNIRYNLKFSANYDFIKIKKGWAFVEGQPPLGNVTFVLLASDSKKYVYHAVSYQRPDLQSRFDKAYLHAGLMINVSKKELQEGTYRMGLIVTRGADILGFQFTDKEFKIRKNIDWLSVELPEETENVQHYFRLIEERNNFRIKNGWAFIEGLASYQSKTFMVLKSATDHKILETIPVDRFEVASKYGHKYLRAGFRFKIAKEDLKKGKYQIGLLMFNTKEEKIEGFKLTGHELIHEDAYIGPYVLDQVITEDLKFPQTTNKLKHAIEFEPDQNTATLLTGWAYMEGLETKDQEIYLIFESDNGTYFFETKGTRRHELAKEHGLQYIDGGFTFEVNRNKLKSGNYRLGILVAENNEIVGFKFTKLKLKFDGSVEKLD